MGALAYCPPRHSFLIFYKQNGEVFSHQKLGHLAPQAVEKLPKGDCRATLRFERASVGQSAERLVGESTKSI